MTVYTQKTAHGAIPSKPRQGARRATSTVVRVRVAETQRPLKYHNRRYKTLGTCPTIITLFDLLLAVCTE